MKNKTCLQNEAQSAQILGNFPPKGASPPGPHPVCPNKPQKIKNKKAAAGLLQLEMSTRWDTGMVRSAPTGRVGMVGAGGHARYFTHVPDNGGRGGDRDDAGTPDGTEGHPGDASASRQGHGHDGARGVELLVVLEVGAQLIELDGLRSHSGEVGRGGVESAGNLIRRRTRGGPVRLPERTAASVGW